MPYANKWKIEGNQASTGDDWIVYIQDRELDSDDITEIDPGGTLIEVRYSPIGFYSGTPHWNIAPSSISVQFAEDGTGVLSQIIGADDERYKISITGDGTTEGSWFVLPDSYSYKLYGKSIGTLRGHDRLQDLQNIAYSPSAGVLYAGRVSLLKVITQCLDSTGLDLGISTHMNWFPHFGSNELDTSDDPLVNLFVDQEIFQDEDGNPFSKFTVLEQILNKFQLQLFQSENRWFIQHRKRAETTTADNYKVYQYTSAGAADSPTTANHPLSIDVGTTSSDNHQFFGGALVSGTIPYGEVSQVYYHKNPFANLFSDLSFEVGLNDTVGGTPLINQAAGYAAGVKTIGIDGLTPSVNIPSGYRFTIDTDSTNTEYQLTAEATVDVAGRAENMSFEPGLAESVANNDGLTFHEDRGGWERFNSTHTTETEGQNTSEEDVKALRLDVEFNAVASYGVWVRQESTGPIAGTTGNKLKTGWWLRAEGTGATTDVMHAFKMYVTGSSETWYFKWSDNTWTNTDTMNEFNMQQYELLNEQWHKLDITTNELNDGSDDIIGELTIEFYEGREHDGGGSQNITYIYVDNVDEPVIILSDGTPANEATQTLLTYEGNVNRAKPAVPTLVFGDGPTPGHIARLTATDSTGASVDTTDDWSYLPTVGSTNYTLEQFWANQMLQEFGEANKKVRLNIFSSEGTTPPKPHQYFRLANPNNALEYDYTWQDLVYRPAARKNIFTGLFVQFKETIVADQLCTVDIKPNTALLAGIDVEEGIVCDATSDFTPTRQPTHIYWLEDRSGTYYICKAEISEDTTWTRIELAEVLSTRTAEHIAVDQASNYIFCIEQTTATSEHNIMRRDLEGNNSESILYYVGGGTHPTILAADRIGKTLLVNDEAGVGHSINEYDYDGTLVEAKKTEVAGNGAWVAYDETGAHWYYRHTQTGVDEFHRDDTDIYDSTLSQSDDPDEVCVDEDYGEAWIMSAADDKLVAIDVPNGTSEDTLVTGLAGGGGLGMDRSQQWLYHPGATAGIIQRTNFANTTTETVYDDGIVNATIKSICLGFN